MRRAVGLLSAIVVSAAILSAMAPPAAAGTPSLVDHIIAIIGNITRGKDAAFGVAVGPAQSLNQQVSDAARVEEINTRMKQELGLVIAVFSNAPSAEKVAATRAAVAQFDAETARDGASRAFEGTGPSLSAMRQLLFVPVGAPGEDRVERVMQVISQFERSPKTDDTYYEYTDPTNMGTSQIIDLPGSETSWTTGAQPPMKDVVAYLLKTCRHIFLLGWYCNTSLYQVRAITESGGVAKLLVAVLRPLSKGADNPRFHGGRAENIVDGFTGVYVVMASDDMILVYNLGYQEQAGAPGHQTLINEGHKQEYRELINRIQVKLGIDRLPF
jgi:hypothetical protein